MEVHDARVRPPLGDRLADSGVVKCRRSPQPSCQSLLGADVVTREDMQPTETAQQHIFGGPPSDTTQLTQVRTDVVISLLSQPLQVNIVPFDCAGEREKRSDLLPAEPERPITRSGQFQHVARLWKSIVAAGSRPRPPGAHSGESVQ